MTKRQYLELMGIDVWQKRLPRQTVSRPPVAEIESQVMTGTDATGHNSPVVASAPAQDVATGAAALASVKRSLQTPGDQTSPSSAAETNTGNQPKVVEAEAARDRAKPTVSNGEPELEFFLAFSHFQQLTMVNIYPGGFAGIPGNHQRFLLSLLFALQGEKQTSEVQEFRWPMLQSKQISQSKADAQKILGRHLQQCRANVLVLGADTAELLSAEANTLYAAQQVANRQLVLVDDTEVYFRDPGKRRELWQALVPLKNRMRGSG